MPTNLGKYKQLKLDSVAGKAEKTITLLKNLLPSSATHDHVVVFLGETHGSAVDQAVTAAMLANPPYVRATAGENRVIFERGLSGAYPITSAAFGSSRNENSALGTGNTARSAVMGDMIIDAFENHGVRVIYLPCGSKHATEVFGYVNAKFGHSFDFLSKLDDASYKS